MIPNNPRIQKWEKPPCDFIKINVDAAIINNMTGLGVIARDSNGLVLGSITDYMENQIEGECAEAEDLRDGIIWAQDSNVTRAIFETDCTSLVNRIKKHREDITIFSNRMKKIANLLDFFTEVKINWIGQMSNRVAICLSKLALNKHCTPSLDMEYPYDIYELVMIDSCMKGSGL
ncbi:hypothetical protein J1N35_025783 [Gossypium stocksii]|uniref:RNase H type-1 domain-containing protein n=1 Tax=Gossypium stocksii TaxID=47602 RepID=A0A9D3ZWI9_9ROSI|nr:hypothetical protein J1N35_025783 [Gossypium stocksii]